MGAKAADVHCFSLAACCSWEVGDVAGVIALGL